MAKKDGRDEPGLVHVPGGKLARALGTSITPLVARPLVFERGVLVEPDEIVGVRLINPTAYGPEESYDRPLPPTPEKFAALLEKAGTDKFRLIANVRGREVVSGQVFFNPVELITFYPPKAGDAIETALAVPAHSHVAFSIKEPRPSGDWWQHCDYLNLTENRDWLGLVHTRFGAKTPLMPEDRIFLPGRGLFSAADLLDGQARGNPPGLRVERVDSAIPLPARTRKALE